MSPQVFTPFEQCTLHSFKVNCAIKRSNLSLQIKGTFPFEYPVYANKPYAINRTIFLYLQFWFGILESYAIKQFMCLIDMKLVEVVCNCLGPLAKFDWV